MKQTRSAFQKQIRQKARQRQTKHIFVQYGIIFEAILLVLASYLLTDRYFEGAFMALRYVAALFCFIGTIFCLIKRGKEKGEIKRL